MIRSFAHSGGVRPACSSTPSSCRGSTRTENRLASESSPYLLQHRSNPVDWYPWGEEAFEVAGAGDRPIFLSIGYATCHWCHVMERESFEDETVAGLLNADFVSIKVDREERPDIDQIYMTVCQLAGGHCGWPLTVLLTPDKRPFFVATYIPRESRHGRTGLLELLPRVAELWRTDRSGILASAGEITDALLETQMGGAAFNPAILDAAVTQYEQRFDSQHGGFSSAPKFPTAHNLLFLMERATRGNTPGDAPGRLPPMVSHTLDRMRRGGIFDHVGYGFHRYSTDREWKLPHFEKMLYDQAMLCLAYAEGFGRSGDENFARTARRVAAYVGRVLTSDDGAFYSAEDADSEGEEGRFYVWTMPELVDVLGRERARLVSEIFGVRPEGNFADEATGETSGQNVLHSISKDDVLLDETRAILFAHRENRPHPLLDDKILVDWNGLMIASLARAGFMLDDATLIEQSARAASWILDVMEDDGLLMHRYRGGEVGIRGMLDDYAFFTWGLTELYLATWDATWLEHAIRIAKTQIQLFLDEDNGGFFLTDREAPVVLLRPKEMADGALPAGNSISVLNYARLFALTGEPRFEEIARGALDAAATLVGRYPSAFGACLFAAEVALGPSTEIVVVGERGTQEVDEMLRVVRRHSESRRMVSMLVDTANGDRIRRLAPFTSSMSSAGPATAFVCSGFVCDLPVTSAAALEAKLHRG